MLTKKMSSAPTDTITLNKKKILTSIAQTDKYTEDGLTIRKWEGEEGSRLFIADINKNNIKFLGILNSKLQRESYGINYFNNGERYFGHYTKDLRDKHGVYIWPSKIDGNYRETEIYYGLWRDNQKDDHGVYIWLREDKNTKPLSNFEEANFDAYVGEIRLDAYVRGTYLIKNLSDFYLYHGNFSSEGKKYGDKCFYYNATFDRLMYGKVVNDYYVSGYLAEFNGDGVIDDLLRCEYDEKHQISSYQERDEIPIENREKIETEMSAFRNIILSKDYFGDIYSKFNEVSSFVDNKMNDLQVLDSSDDFPLIMSISVQYNNLSIYQDIEKNLLLK